MLSKTRTTIITLATAFSLGGASVVPTAAQARKKKPGLSTHVCSELKKIYEMDIEFAKTSTSQQEYNLWTNEAFNALYAAEQGGCSWARGREVAVQPEGEPPRAVQPPSENPPPTRPAPPPPAGSHA